MKITCAVSPIQLEKIYTAVSKKMKQAQSENTPFDADAYMKDLFKKITKAKDIDTAVKFLQPVPLMVFKAYSTLPNFINDVELNVDPILKLNKLFADPNVGLRNVLKHFAPQQSQSVLKEAVFQTELTASKIPPSSVDRLEPVRLEPTNVFSTTFQQFETLDPNKLDETLIQKSSEERKVFYTVFNNIQKAENVQEEGVTGTISYQGVEVTLKPMKLSDMDVKDLDKITGNFLLKASAIIRAGKSKANVINPNEVILTVLADKEGNPIKFDNNGNITQTGGQIVYQMMRNVVKKGGKYQPVNLYGYEVLANNVARIMADQEVTQEVAEKIFQEQLKGLYDLNKSILNGDIKSLALVGFSAGVEAAYTQKSLTLGTLSKFGLQDSIRTITPLKSKDVYKSTINIRGEQFTVNRPALDQATAEKIADVLINDKLDYNERSAYIKQFLSPYTKSRKQRRHGIKYLDSNKTIQFSYFEDTFQKNPTEKSKPLDLKSPEAKSIIVDTLMNASEFKNVKYPISVIFNESNLASDAFVDYNVETGKFQKSSISYSDYLASLKGGKIDLSSANAEKVFNQYMNFAIPSKVTKSLEDAKEKQPSEIRKRKDALAAFVKNAGAVTTATISAVENGQRPGDKGPYAYILFQSPVDGQTMKIYLANKYKYGNVTIPFRIGTPITFVLEEKIDNKDKIYIPELLSVVDSTTGEVIGNVQETDFAADEDSRLPYYKELYKNRQTKSKEEQIDDATTKAGTNTPYERGIAKRFGLERSGTLPADKGTSEQNKKAIDWWNKSELSKYLDLEVGVNIVNSDAFAKFISYGGILAGKYGTIQIAKKGSSVDLYHEAWHGFTQLFLSPKEKRALYREVKRALKGSKNYSVQEIEEILAEEFRTYAKNPKAKKGSPKRNTFFRRILNFLKKLFGVGYASNVMEIQTVQEMFEALYYNKGLNKYTPTIENVQFDELERNIGITEPGTDKQALTRSESLLVKDSMDSIISDIVDEVTMDLRSTDSENNKGMALKLVLDPGKKSILYDVIKERLEEKLNEFKTQRVEVAEENEFVVDQLDENIRVLTAAVENYGTATDGTVGFHLKNSTYKILADTYIEDELTKDENTAEEVGERFADKKVGDKSLLEFAGKETIYMLKSLHDTDKKGKTKLNSLGFKKLADFRLTWNNVVRTIASESDPQVMYDKLVKAGDMYAPFKQLTSTKLPNPSIAANNIYDFKATTSFWQDFNKSRVPYIQLTLFKDDTAKVNNASADARNIINTFRNQYMSDMDNPYTTLNPSSKITELNLEKVIQDFGKNGKFDTSKSVEFLRAIGLYVDNIDTIRTELTSSEGQRFYGLEYIYGNLKNVYDKVSTQDAPLSKTQTDRLSDLLQDPVKTLQRPLDKSITSTSATSQKTQIDRIARLQGRFGEAANIFGVQNAEGNIVYEYIENNTVSTRTSKINDAEDFQNLIDSKDNPMNYLSPDINPFTSKSVLLRSMYSLNSTATNGKRIQNANLELFLDSGTTKETGGGTNTSDLDEGSKFSQELHMMLLGGTQEFIRAASKKSAFGLKFTGSIKSKLGFDLNKKNSNLYIDIDKFGDYRGTQELINNEFMLGYLASEANRIHKFKSNPEFKNYVGFNNKLANGRIAGESFTIFDDVLTDDTKQEIYDIIDENEGKFFDLESYLENENITLQAKIKGEINQYFNKLVTEVRLTIAENDYLSKNLLEEVNKITEDPLGQQKLLAMAYTYNSWIHNFETANLLEGDLSQYNHEKEELSKRSPGTKSGGKTFRVDKAAQTFVNGHLKKTSYAEQNGKKALRYDGSLNTAIMKDIERDSKYLDQIEKGLREFYSKNFDEARVDELVERDLSVYKGMEEADGQGYITFDAYRSLRFLENDWSYEQEALFQKISRGEYVGINEVTEFFPPYKLFYSGSIKQAKLPVNSMHKFSLMPLIPGVMTGELENLHEQMMDKSIHYSLFKTGSKVSHIASNSEGADIIFDAEDKKQNILKGDIDFTMNTIYVEYLKNVTGVPKKFKKQTIFSTQFRKMILKDLYNRGIITDPDAKDAAERYAKLISDYEKILEEELLSEIGYRKEGDKYIGNINNFLSLVQRELGRRNVPEHQIEFVGKNVNGTLETDLSYHFKAGDIESMIINLIQKRIINQRINGESLVQVSSALTNGMWNQAEYDVATTENIQKYQGTNDLPFYRTKDGSTAGMKVAIAMQGSFKNLLRLDDVAVYREETYIDDSGVENTTRVLDEEASLANLNKLIKDEKWLDANNGENRKKVTIVGTRIPVGGINYMEFGEVHEFLPASAGNIIILPTEIVAKSGSDFDIDKLNIFFPNINSDGSLTEYNSSVEKTIEVANMSTEATQKKIFNTKKLALQNDIMFNMAEILSLKSNYANLVKPNATYLLKEEIADEIGDDVATYDRYANRSQGVKIKVDKNGKETKVISPTRTIEPIYNLQKHTENMIGKRVLGIVAIENALSPIINSQGGKMPKKYSPEIYDDATKRYVKAVTVVNKAGKREVIKEITLPNFIESGWTLTDGDYNMRLFLPHNEFPDGSISISDVTAKDGNNINELYNQLLNGFVDIEKDPWVFNIQGNREVAPILLYLIKAGVPIKSAVQFVSNPYVIEYAAQQRKLGSEYSTEGVERQFVKYQAAGRTIEKIALEQNRKGSLNEFTIDDEDITVYEYITNKNFYDVLSRRMGDKDVFTTSDMASVNRDTISTDPRANNIGLNMFLHFLEIEKQLKGLTSLKLQSNPDTTTSRTLQEIILKEANYEGLADITKVDQELVRKLREESILSSFRIGDLIEDIVAPVFQFRNNDRVNDFLKRELPFIRATRDEKSLLITRFKDSLMDYIFQNYQTGFVDSNGKLTSTPETYMGRKIINREGVERGAMANMTEQSDVIYVDNAKIERDFFNKAYLKNSITYPKEGLRTFNKDIFDNVIQYKKYVIAREYLRSRIPLENISSDKEFIAVKNTLKTQFNFTEENATKQAYEYFLNKEALMDSYNRSVIMGTGAYSYSQTVIDSIDRNADLKQKYPILEQLYIPKQYGNNVGIKVLSLRNISQVKKTEGLGDIYYQNLKDLADPTVKKVADRAENLRLSRLFARLPLISIYQNGTGGYNRDSMIDVLPYENFVNIMNVAGQNFTDAQSNDATFEFVFKKLLKFGKMSTNKFIDLVVDPKEYAAPSKSENISSKGSSFAKKLTNPGNNLEVTYKGKKFRNAEHAYQTYKSGEFDQKAYNSTAFKPIGSKPANKNTNYQTMVNILKAKLEQHPELIEGINERGGLAYIEQSTHNVIGDKFWESKGQNKFIEALADAYKSTQPDGKFKTYTGLVDIKNLKDNEDTVFGSNQDGFHGGGTAGILYANDSRAYKKQKIEGKGLRVIVGQPRGFQTGTEGSSYAIQTVTDWKLPMDDPARQVPKDEIINQIKNMYDYYTKNPSRNAYVLYTTQGRNLNGYSPLEMAEMFASAGPIPSNIIFNDEFSKLMVTDQVNPEIILGPDATGFDTKFSEELSKKIEAVLREKYPNIKLNFTNDPIGFDSSPDVFNQEMKRSQETTQKVIAKLTAPLKKAASQFYAFSRKNKVAFLATMENAIKSDPYKYINVDYGGRVTLDVSALGYLLYDTYGEEILDWSTQQELKRLEEGEKSGMDPNNPQYIKDIEIAEQADKDLEYLVDLEIKKIKDTISGFDNGTKTKKDLFELFVTAQNYFQIGQSMSPYIAKTFPGVRRDFNLQGKEGIYKYNFINGKLDTLYEKVPSKQRERAGKDPVTGKKLYKDVTYYSSEEITSSDDRWIDAQLALKDFKNNTDRIKKGIDHVALENLEKESLKQRLKVQFQTPEQRKADLAKGRISEFELSWDHYYGPAPSSAIESGLSDLAEDILATNGITDGLRGLTSPTYFHNSNDLLERTKNEQYVKLKAKQDLVKYVLANKDEFTADDKDINTAGDIMAPVPGWFLNAVTAASSGKLFRDLDNPISIAVLSMTATDQWDKVQEGLFTGYEAPFQKLADLTDLNSRLTNKLVYGSTTNVFSDLYLLNQTYKDKIIGQANIKAMTVLIDAANQKQDTLPHEYAHHYIAYFRDNEIVQEGIRRFGGEEALVQAIGEQVVAQKGEALNWWKKFTKWLLNLLSDKQVLQILTDSFLTRRNLNTDFTTDTTTGDQRDLSKFEEDVKKEFGPDGKPPIDRTDEFCPF